MAKRLTQDEWRAARARYEADPKVSFAVLATEYGISKQSIGERAKREGWQRTVDQKELARKATARADAALVKNPLPARVEPAARIEMPPEPAPLPKGAPPTEEERAAAEDRAVDERARVIDRHRREWDGVRSLTYEAMKARDFEKGKLAKITSETMRNIHEGERKAWGLDAGKEEGTVVVIERGGD